MKAFNRSDDISRVMPGKKDFISVNVNGGRVHAQKRLVLCNLKEAFENFKDKFPDIMIGFFKFADLRLK